MRLTLATTLFTLCLLSFTLRADTAPIAGPILARSPELITRSVPAGHDADAGSISIRNVGGGVLHFTVGTETPWIDPQHRSGENTGEYDVVSVSFPTAGLLPGGYTGRVAIASIDASNAPQLVKVVVTVLPPPPPPLPTILRSPEVIFLNGLAAPTQPPGSIGGAFYVRNGGGGLLHYGINTETPWLSPHPTIGESTGEVDRIAVGFDATGLTPGCYTGRVEITSADAGNSPLFVKVILTLAPPPPPPPPPPPSSFIMRSPEVIYLATPPAPNTTGNGFYVRNGGTGTLHYAISTESAWLSPHPTTGDSTGEIDRIEVGYDVTGLNAGVYTGRVDITSADAANSPQSVRIILKVTPPPLQQPPTIVRVPEVVFARFPADQLQATLGVTGTGTAFYVRNGGTGELRYALSSADPWLSTDPTSGSSTGEYDRIHVICHPDGLAPAVYTGHVDIAADNATNSPQSVTVVYAILPPPVPVLAREPAVVQRMVPHGRNAETAFIYLRNIGGGTLHYTLADDSDWFSVDPVAGDSKGEVDRVRVDFQTDGLALGLYTGQVTISSTDASNAPQFVQILLKVVPPLPTPPPPFIVVRPESISRGAVLGSNVQSQVMYVWNAGTGVLHFALSTDASWLSVDPALGSSEGNPVVGANLLNTTTPLAGIQVMFDVTGLGVGTYTGHITVASQEAVNSPVVVPVLLKIYNPPVTSNPELPRIISIEQLGPALMKVTWMSAPDQTYTLLKARTYHDTFFVVASGLAATPPVNVYYDSDPEITRLYRLKVETP